MSEERATWIHPDAVRLGNSEDSDDSQTYRRGWKALLLKMEDYQFERWFSFRRTDKHIDDDEEIESISALIAEKGWDALEKNQKDAFESRHLKSIQAKPMPESLTMIGWAKFAYGEDNIVSLAADGDPHYRSGDFNKDYNQSFERVRVVLGSKAEGETGYFSIWSSGDFIEFWHGINPDREIPDEDVLVLHLYAPPERMKALADELALLPKRPELFINVSALLFEDEPDWDPGRHRALLMLYDHKPSVVLETIRWHRLSSKDEDLFSLGS